MFTFRFHAYSHKCSGFWKLGNYPCDATTVSTSSESLNAFIQNYRGMCVYMKQETFIVFLSVLIAIRNWYINIKLKNYEKDVQ